MLILIMITIIMIILIIIAIIIIIRAWFIVGCSATKIATNEATILDKIGIVEVDQFTANSTLLEYPLTQYEP